jgi:hypothetical protein
MTLTTSQIAAAQRIGLHILDAIDEAGELGAPSGVMYAALMAQGCSLQQYQSIMAPLERRGFVTVDGDCYFMTAAGREFKEKLCASLGPDAAARDAAVPSDRQRGA